MKQFPKIPRPIKSYMSRTSKGLLIGGAIGISSLPSTTEAAITYSSTPSLPYPSITDYGRANYTTGPVEMTVIDSSTCSHVSGVVNGHLSVTPSVNSSYVKYNLYSHASHGSHGSHCNWMC